MVPRVVIAATLLILIGYGILKAFPLLSGPEITIASPADGQSFQGGLVEVKGAALHTESMTLNGAPLLIDQRGAFNTSLVLPPGGAILSLTATDRFGKSRTVRRTIFVP